MSLRELTSCPFCNRGHNTPCFAKYDDGYKCFSCGKASRKGKSFRYLSNTHCAAKRLDFPDVVINPKDFTGDYLKWLYSYYIFDDLIYKNSINQRKDNNHLIYPVIKNNKLEYWQERGINPKYCHSAGKKQYQIKNPNSGTLIIVEDFLSQVRIAEFYSSICLWGTSASDDIINEIIGSNYNNIGVWLDHDLAGQTAAEKLIIRVHNKIKQRMRRFGFRYTVPPKVKHIVSFNDPKCYSNIELFNIVQNEFKEN